MQITNYEDKEKLEIIERITYSSWGSPIVTVIKKMVKYVYMPITKPIKQIFKWPVAKMSGGRYFCALPVDD